MGSSSPLFEGCPLWHYFSLENALGQKVERHPLPTSSYLRWDAVSSSLSSLGQCTELQVKPEGGRGDVLKIVE